MSKLETISKGILVGLIFTVLGTLMIGLLLGLILLWMWLWGTGPMAFLLFTAFCLFAGGFTAYVTGVLDE